MFFTFLHEMSPRTIYKIVLHVFEVYISGIILCTSSNDGFSSAQRNAFKIHPVWCEQFLTPSISMTRDADRVGGPHWTGAALV